MKKYLITGAVCFVVGFGVSSYFKEPAQVKTETVEVVKIKENIKYVKETRPDGTVIETQEQSTEKDNSKYAKVDKKNGPKWILSVKKDVLNQNAFTGELSRALFNNVFIGGYYRTDNVAGVSVSITF